MQPPLESRSSRVARFFRPFVVVGLLAVGAITNSGCTFGSEPVVCNGGDEYGTIGTSERAYDLRGMQDDPDATQWISGSIDGDRDDWFRVPIRDTGLGGDPNVHVRISDGYAVTTWFLCGGGRRGSSACTGDRDSTQLEGFDGCTSVVPPPAVDERGNTVISTYDVASLTTDCPGTSDDDGMLYIRVRRASSYAASCSYDLGIDVD